MIISKAFDIEVFPNLFSVTFVDIKSYLDIFKDCIDEKGNPIPMAEKISVANIKDRLDIVKSDVFYISDSDDSQLLSLVSYFNKMIAHFEDKVDDKGVPYQIPVRTDLYGFNSVGYDNIMVAGFLTRFNQFHTTKELITWLYELSKKIISLQNDSNLFYEDKEIQLLRQYRLPYASCDLFKVFALNSAGVNVDKDTGERVKFGKSLKQTSINLKWYELLDYTLPPIDEEEYNIYWRHISYYKGLSLDSLNKLITSDFDRYILPKYVDDMLHYNKNDVFIVCEMARQKPDEIKLRYSLEYAFKIPVLSSARSNISDKLLVKFYSQMSGLHPYEFVKKRTERTRLSFNKIIFPHIKFKTKELQDLLDDMKKVFVYHTSNKDFERTITFRGTTYTLACGGIHSVDRPAILKSTEDYTYVHWDYTSYYPSIMISYNIAPKHLNVGSFVKMVKFFKDTRVKCKHTKDEIELVITGVHNKVSAEALKIVINAIYGKLGFADFWLYDRLAQLKVTINGQLMTMTLVEELELNGIHVISANTDGIVVKLPNDKREVFKDITDRWNETNKMSADGEEYKLLVVRDINNYFDIQIDGSVEFKGSFDPKQYIKDLKKGYDMPIVAECVYRYFVDGTPVMETLRKHKSILDFCKTQNVGKQFDVVYDKVENGKIVSVLSQRHVRFYVSTYGVVIQKQHKTTGARSRLASGLSVKILNTLDDIPIEERDINYKYYYDEAYKIIDPIKLGISPNQKANANTGMKSGKVMIKKNSHAYLSLFDDDDNDNIIEQ